MKVYIIFIQDNKSYYQQTLKENTFKENVIKPEIVKENSNEMMYKEDIPKEFVQNQQKKVEELMYTQKTKTITEDNNFKGKTLNLEA